MSTRKSKEQKDFLITIRKTHSSQLSPAPVWVIQKSGKRKYNPKQQRNWRETHLMDGYDTVQKHIAGHKSKKKQRKKTERKMKRRKN